MTQQQGGQRVWRAAVIVLLASIATGCGGEDDPGPTAGSEQPESSADPTTTDTTTTNTTSADPASTETTEETTSTDTATGETTSEPGSVSLAGSWVRVDGAACGDGYPLTIEFREIDYLAELDPAVAPVIDSGGYEVIDPTTIQMTRPNDAMVTLTLDLGDDELTLTDEDGCAIDYRRA